MTEIDILNFLKNSGVDPAFIAIGLWALKLYKDSSKNAKEKDSSEIMKIRLDLIKDLVWNRVRYLKQDPESSNKSITEETVDFVDGFVPGMNTKEVGYMMSCIDACLVHIDKEK